MLFMYFDLPKKKQRNFLLKRKMKMKKKREKVRMIFVGFVIDKGQRNQRLNYFRLAKSICGVRS